jgi:hypothetical protein
MSPRRVVSVGAFQRLSAQKVSRCLQIEKELRMLINYDLGGDCAVQSGVGPVTQ